MKHWFFSGLLQETGWLSDVYVSCDQNGRIKAISKERPEGEVTQVSGYAVPGFQNAHSHVFQYAMAGLAENLRREDDDFWSWREVMYDLALTMSPERLEAIAAWAYAEMARHGYTAVTEFHYLHHREDGTLHQNPAEMGRRLMAAAEKAGIHLTLIPIFYRWGDFGREPSPHQRRFISPGVDHYLRLQEASKQAAEDYDRVRVGWGIHSLRAADAEDVSGVFEAMPADAPFHIHIAEQQKEVRGCLDHHGKRPVAWLLDNAPLDQRCFLVHATHIDAQELAGITAAGSGVVICPSTEGNLGDGFFPFRDFRRAGGSWSIGTDSHIGLSPMEELRWLDYGQRLGLEKRNVICLNGGEDSGQIAFHQSLIGGRRAMGEPNEHYFREGDFFDAVVLDGNHPLIAGVAPERRLSTFIYGGDAAMIQGTITAGEWVVQDGRHRMGQSFAKDFVEAVAAIRGR